MPFTRTTLILTPLILGALLGESGCGSACQLTGPVGTLDFGFATFGNTTSQQVPVNNTGSGTCHVSRVLIKQSAGDPMFFSVTSASGPFDIRAGASAIVTVAFLGDRDTQVSAALEIQADGVVPFDIGLTGLGSLPPATMDGGTDASSDAGSSDAGSSDAG
jgi:hypothetical protein